MISLRRVKKKIARSSLIVVIMSMSLISININRFKKWNAIASSFLIPKRIGMLLGKQNQETDGKETAYMDKIRIIVVDLPSS